MHDYFNGGQDSLFLATMLAETVSYFAVKQERHIYSACMTYANRERIGQQLHYH